MRPLLLSSSSGLVLWPDQKFPLQDEHSCERVQTSRFNTPPTSPPSQACSSHSTNTLDFPAAGQFTLLKKDSFFLLSFSFHLKCTLSLKHWLWMLNFTFFCSRFCKRPLENTAQTQGNVTEELKISFWVLKLLFLQERKKTFPEQALLVSMHLINSTISLPRAESTAGSSKIQGKKCKLIHMDQSI